MQKPTQSTDQNLQIKQSIEFLTLKDINPSIRLIIDHYSKINKTLSEQIQLSNVSAHLQKFLKFVIEKNTSFIVRQNYGTHQIIGCCINLDVKDLIGIFDTSMNFPVFQTLGMFSQKLKNWLYRLGDSSRGDYLYNIVTVFLQNQLHNNPIDYILKGMAFSKVIGWKNILYPSSDPFFMLKFGSQIIGIVEDNHNESLYKKQNTEFDNNFEQNLSMQEKEEKVKLQKIPFKSLTYVMALKLEKTIIQYFEIQNDQKKNIFRESNGSKDLTVTKKLYIFPKL